MTAPIVVDRIETLRAQVARWRAEGHKIGLVPTMGALHQGHVSLVEEARKHAARIIVTIFVNPAQFGPSEDFGKYPRTLEADVEKLATVGADLCFAPPVDEIYPKGFSTRVEMSGPARAELEDSFRPSHFSGVATIVAKLLNQAQADVAVFGEKDYQQLLAIRRLARDLDIPTQIRAAPTLREPDGLAMSSRNVYLSSEERRVAPALYGALREAARRIRAGEGLGAALDWGRATIAEAGFAIDYVEIRHADTLARVKNSHDGPLRLLAAAKLGSTRLIDNIAV